jgi:hypothetical protein
VPPELADLYTTGILGVYADEYEPAAMVRYHPDLVAFDVLPELERPGSTSAIYNAGAWVARRHARSRRTAISALRSPSIPNSGDTTTPWRPISAFDDGSKVYIEMPSDSQVAFGQSRVLWTRLIMPNGRSIVLERQPGADTAGYPSLEDEVDNHRGTLFKALLRLLGVGSEVGSTSGTGSNSDVILTLRWIWFRNFEPLRPEPRIILTKQDCIVSKSCQIDGFLRGKTVSLR